MEWSNLNQQMIEEFFLNSNSPTSNHQISLNFTRTSRQMSNKKTNRQLSPKIQNQIQQQQKRINYEQQQQEQNKLYTQEQNKVNPQSNILSIADKQINKFNEWYKGISITRQKNVKQVNYTLQNIEQQVMKQFNINTNNKQYHESKNKQKRILQNNILIKVQQLQKKINKSNKCQNCIKYQKQITSLQFKLLEIQTHLQSKIKQINNLNQHQIKQLCYELQYMVQNRILNDKIALLSNKNEQLSKTIQCKSRQLNKCNEQIDRYNLQRSTYHYKNKTLQTKMLQLQKSKLLLLSAAKNSTSHSQFNITTNHTTNSNNTMLKSSQTNQHIDNSSLIHTNQFGSQKHYPIQKNYLSQKQFGLQKQFIIQKQTSADDYIQWFEKLKQIFLQKYKRQQKQYLIKFHPDIKNNSNRFKQVINNFKKGHVRYEIARSCKNISDYIKKNRDNFIQLLSTQLISHGIVIKVQSNNNVTVDNNNYNSNNNHSSYTTNNQNKTSTQQQKIIQQLQQQVRKSQKICCGLQSQIINLNSQLSTIKKTLIKQKQDKSKLSTQIYQLQQELNQLHQQLNYNQQQLQSLQNKSKLINHQQQQTHTIQLIHQLEDNLAHLQQQLIIKSQDINTYITQINNYQQSQLKLNQSIKQSQRLLYRQRHQKIKFFKQSLPNQSLTTACRIKNKSINQKKLNSIIHQFEGRVYVQKQKMSYKFDIVQQIGKKSFIQILSYTKKIILNCLYQPSNSLILSMGSSQSEFKEYFRGQQGLIWTCITDIYKLRFNQKRFLQIDVSFNVIQITNSQIFDLFNNDIRKRVVQNIKVQKYVKIQFQTQQQAKSVLNEVFSKQIQQNSHLITIIQFSVTDKRTKNKHISKLYFAEVGLNKTQKQSYFGQQNLNTDSKAIGNIFNSINFKQSYRPQVNRLTYLLSDCLNEKSKNLMVINVSPIQVYKQNSLYSLNYGSNLKYLAVQKPQSSLIRYTQRTPQHSVSKLQHNHSHSLIQTPTLNPDQIEQKTKSITKHRNSSSEHVIYGGQNGEKKKRTISRLSIC